MDQRAVYDIDAVAARLHKAPIWLHRWLRRNPVDQYGTPFFFAAGRTKLFHEKDIARIEDALRDDLRQTLESERPDLRRRRRVNWKPSASSADLWAQARTMFAKPLRNPK